MLLYGLTTAALNIVTYIICNEFTGAPGLIHTAMYIQLATSYVCDKLYRKDIAESKKSTYYVAAV